MKKAIFYLFVSIIINLNTVYAQNTTKIEGVVVDENNIFLPYASISIEGQVITTTSNAGNFIVELSNSALNDSLSISYIGYKTFKTPLLNLYTGLKVQLLPDVISLNEVVIKPVNAESIIVNAIKNVSQNYDTRPFEMIGFYREVGRIDSNYLSFAEAALNILNQGYNTAKEKDLVVVKKERSLKKIGDREVNNPFHAAVKGVPYIVLDNDIVKYPGAIFGGDYLSKYKYEVVGSISVNGEDAYVIKFDQKDGIKKALYKGKVIIIKSSYAIVSIDFALSPKGIKYADPDVPAVQRPILRLLGYSLRKINEELSGKYMKLNGKWYPYFYQIKTTHRVKAKKQKIDGELHISAELLISKINEQPQKYYGREVVMPHDYIFRKVTENYSDSFWDGFVFVKPTNSLREIAEKINAN